MRFNPPPGWPQPPAGWLPPNGWVPDPSWPPAPAGWVFVVDDAGAVRQMAHSPYEMTPGTAVVPQTGWHYAPTPVAAAWGPPVAPHPRVDNVAAWMLAVSPILWVLGSIVALQSGFPSAVAVVPFLIASWLLCVWDISNVRRAGVKMSSGMWIGALVAVPAYVVQRTLRTKQTWWIPSLWAITVIVSLAMTPLIAILGGVEYDPQYVEDEIEADLADVYDMPGAEVTCPDPAIAPVGSFFMCDAVYTDGSTETINVDVLDWTGGWNWSS